MSAWINCVKYAEAPTTAQSTFSLDVPGDIGSTPTIIEGGRPGDTVTFHVGSFVANETGVWIGSTNEQLDINAPSAPTVAAGPGNLQATINALAVGGTINVAAGRYDENITVNNFVTFNAPAGTLELTGDFTFNCGDFVHNGGTVAFTRSGSQALTLGVPVRFNNVVVGSGTNLTQVGQARRATAIGTIANSGQINATETVNTTGVFAFGLTSASINVTTRGSLNGTLAVSRYSGNHPAATTPLETGQYWVITPPTGANYTATLTLPATFAPDSFDKLCRYTGSTPAWDCGTDAVHTHTGNSITRSGVRTFSPWTVGDNTGPNAVNVQGLSARAGVGIGDRMGSLLALGVLGLAGVGMMWLARRR